MSTRLHLRESAIDQLRGNVVGILPAAIRLVDDVEPPREVVTERSERCKVCSDALCDNRHFASGRGRQQKRWLRGSSLTQIYPDSDKRGRRPVRTVDVVAVVRRRIEACCTPRRREIIAAARQRQGTASGKVAGVQSQQASLRGYVLRPGQGHTLARVLFRESVRHPYHRASLPHTRT